MAKPKGTVSETESNTTDGAIPAPVSRPSPQSESPTTYANEILRANKQYKALYIDKQGGIYTPDTPEQIRKAAVYFENPFYKPL